MFWFFWPKSDEKKPDLWQNCRYLKLHLVNCTVDFQTKIVDFERNWSNKKSVDLHAKIVDFQKKIVDYLAKIVDF